LQVFRDLLEYAGKPVVGRDDLDSTERKG
jgi:hypothetical protein